jgi:hypothetical protein
MKRAQPIAPHRIPSRLTAIAAGCAIAFAMPTLAQAATVEFVLSDGTVGGQYLSAVTDMSADRPAALANAQFRTGATNASVQNGLVGSDVTGSNSGTVTVTGNTSLATSTLNTASNSLSGTGAQSITSAANQAVVTLNLPLAALVGSTESVTSTIDATQVVANQQVTRDAGSTAKVDTVTVRGRVDGDMASALTVDRNTLSAQLTGNTATNVFNQQGGAGQFTGSVAVSNQQANTAALASNGDIVDQMNATVTASPIRAEVTGTLSSSITLSSNQQTANVQGNVAGARDANGRILAGNALIISGANAVTGSLDGYTTGGLGDAVSERRELSGALALGSMQRSENTAYKANVSDSEIKASALKADANKTITVRDNLQQASATGNLAGSLLSVEANSISASASALNRQLLQNSKVESVIEYSSTVAETDTVAEINNGRITVSGNRALATSTGNAGSLSTSLSANSIETNVNSRNSQYTNYSAMTSSVANQDVRATSFQNSSTAVTVSGNAFAASTTANTTSTQVTLTGTSVLANVYEKMYQGMDEGVQGSTGSTAQSLVDTTNIAIDTKSKYATLTVSDNQLTARTVGNAADTRTQIVGTQLGSGSQALSFDVFGNQTVESSSTLSSTVKDSSIRVSAYPAADGSTTTVSGNTMLASTTANTYQRALVLDGTSINAGASRLDTIQYSSAPITSKVESAFIGINSLTSAATSSAVVSGNTILALAAANQATTATAINATSLSTSDITSTSQEMRTSMTASAQADQRIRISNAFNGGGNATVSNNITAAQATANANTNQMVLDAGSLTVGIAKVESEQRRAGSVQAIADGIDGSLAIVAVKAATGKVLGGSLTVQSNQMAAVAIGNTGVNTLQATAVNATGTFELYNTQNSESTDIIASTKPRLIGIDAITGNGTSGNGVAMVVSGNSASASASANTATNQITLATSSALNAPATLQSRQISEGLVSAVVGDTTAVSPVKTLVGVAPLNSARAAADQPITVSYGTVTVSDNRLVAQASANTVSNALNLDSAGSVGSSGSWRAYALNSNQISTGAVQTTVNSAYVGVDAASVTAAPLTVSGNTVAAVSAANTASNAMTASALPGSPVFATLSVINNQTATNSVTSTVSGVTIGNTVGGGSPSGAMTVSGNTMVAQAGGNSAINRIIGR